MKDITPKNENVNKSSGGAKPKFWKKWWFWIIVVIVVAAVAFTDTPEDKPESEPVANTTTEQPKETEKVEESEKPTQEPAEQPKETEHRKGMYGVSDKNIKDTDIYFGVTKVRNDVTEKWKISTISENIEFLDYALSYYKEYFSDDSEVHAIVNFANKTTTKVTVVAGQIDVSIFEYVDKEEHDAKALFGGSLLKEYSIYTDNGDIEEIK